MKTPVVTTKDFIIYLEEDHKLFFIHCDVLSKWSKKIKKDLQFWFNRLTIECGKELYALHTPGDKKHEKFLKMFHFSYLDSIKGNDNNFYDIYVWR